MSEAPRLFVKKEELKRFEGKKSEEKQLRSRAEISGRPEEGQEIAIVAGDRKVVMNEYLPKGVRFAGVEGGGFGYYDFMSGKRRTEETLPIPRLQFPPEELGELRGRLALLHEIGHITHERSSKSKLERQHRILTDPAGTIGDSIRASDAYKSLALPEDREKYYLAEFEKAWSSNNDERQKTGKIPLRYEDLAAAVPKLAKVERASWAEALRLHRTIKNEKGVDILEGAKTEEIFAHIKSIALGSYEQTYAPLLKLAGNDVEVSKKDFLNRVFDRMARLFPN